MQGSAKKRRKDTVNMTSSSTEKQLHRGSQSRVILNSQQPIIETQTAFTKNEEELKNLLKNMMAGYAIADELP